MLKLIICDNCKKEIGKDDKFRSFELNGKRVCEQCYKEALASERNHKNARQVK